MKIEKNTLMIIAVVAAIISLPSYSQTGRDTIKIVGSSTVTQLAESVAEQFSKNTKFTSPQIESTGTDDGLKQFCVGLDLKTPDIVNASRRIKPNELAECQKNGVEVVEIKIGYDGAVVATTGEPFGITRKELFMAMARYVPNPKGSENLIPNPYQKWKDINSKLPANDIQIWIPNSDHSTHEIIVNKILKEECKHLDSMDTVKVTPNLEPESSADLEAALESALLDLGSSPPSKKSSQLLPKPSVIDTTNFVCHTFRDDGRVIQFDDNNKALAAIEKKPTEFVFIGYTYFSRLSVLQGSLKSFPINTYKPLPASISSQVYPLSRALFIYVKKAHVDKIRGLKEYLAEFTSRKAMGITGYLQSEGLVPLSLRERKKARSAVKNLIPLSSADL